MDEFTCCICRARSLANVEAALNPTWQVEAHPQEGELSACTCTCIVLRSDEEADRHRELVAYMGMYVCMYVCVIIQALFRPRRRRRRRRRLAPKMVKRRWGLQMSCSRQVIASNFRPLACFKYFRDGILSSSTSSTHWPLQVTSVSGIILTRVLLSAIRAHPDAPRTIAHHSCPMWI